MTMTLSSLETNSKTTVVLTYIRLPYITLRVRRGSPGCKSYENRLNGQVATQLETCWRDFEKSR